MVNDLIIMTFMRQEEALLAWMGLDMMRDRHAMGVDKATAVIKDKAGRTIIHQSWELGTCSQNEQSQLLCQLAEIIFGSGTQESQVLLIEAGLDHVFLKNVTTALGPDSSALLFYNQKNSLTDTNHLLDILMQMRGTLHHTTFTTAVTETILNQKTNNL